MIKKISIALTLIFTVCLLIGGYIEINGKTNIQIAIITRDNSFNDDKNIRSLDYEVNVKIKKRSLNPLLINKNNKDNIKAIWIDLNTISDFSSEEITNINYLIDDGQTLVFIKDNVNRNYLVNLLGLGDKYFSENKINPNYVLQGIKIEKRNDLYLFTNLLISKKVIRIRNLNINL